MLNGFSKYDHEKRWNGAIDPNPLHILEKKRGGRGNHATSQQLWKITNVKAVWKLYHKHQGDEKQIGEASIEEKYIGTGNEENWEVFEDHENWNWRVLQTDIKLTWLW